MMDKYFSAHSDDKKRKLGAYYTPGGLSDILTDWAISSTKDVILEPSFGGCGFLESCVRSLSKLGSREPISQIHGVDIDSEAFKYLSEKIGTLTEVNGSNFICDDFLVTSPDHFSGKHFDVVVGNPPYVSTHKMSEEQKKTCFNLLKQSKFIANSIGRNPSLWAFFLIHSLEFLKIGARAAWVLPSSVLHADYAKPVLDTYSKYFREVTIYKLYERFFLADGASEVSVVLLAEGFTPSMHNRIEARYSEADDLISLKEQILNMQQYKPIQRTLGRNYKLDSISPTTREAYRDIVKMSYTKELGELAKVTIGMVTGDNKTFIINKKTIDEHRLETEHITPVISRFSQLKGLELTNDRLISLITDNHRVHLLTPNHLLQRHSNVRRYLAKVDRHTRKNNKTFRKRKYWFCPDDGIRSDGFLSCMMHTGVRLVLNSAQVNCTNSVHRVQFKNSLSKTEKKAIAVATMSSLTQLTAEILGRSYGSGVLKLEPTPAKKLVIFESPLLTQSLLEVYSDVENLLLAGKHDNARSIVDQVIAHALNIPMDIFLQFEDAITKLRSERYKGLLKQGAKE